MDSDTETFCTKNHLQLQLEQPTRYADDIRDLETSDDDLDGEEKGEEKEVGEEGVEGEDTKTVQSALTKIPLLYQVEPGCTPLSCYSAIATFIVMTLGIFWLLLISPPKNAIPATIPPGPEDPGQLYQDYQDNYDTGYSSSITETITMTTREPTGGSTPSLDYSVKETPQNLVVTDAES